MNKTSQSLAGHFPHSTRTTLFLVTALVIHRLMIKMFLASFLKISHAVALRNCSLVTEN
ncbi:hypothetical protein CsatB_023578 [Cannabis sativa]